jgi:hypothetical protein
MLFSETISLKKLSILFKQIYFCTECSECVGESGSALHSRFSMPLTQLGAKKYYLGIFFKVRQIRVNQSLFIRGAK